VAGPVAVARSSGDDVNAGPARWLAASAPLAGPVQDIGRRAAQQLARRELARSMYAESVETRIRQWLERLVGDVVNAGNSVPGGLWSTIALLIALVLVVAGVTFWIRPAGGRQLKPGALLSGSQLSASDHRQLAERHAAGGDYSAAIIERMRAIAVGIEERGILPIRPGRTADELAAQAGQALPEQACELAAAAVLFDDVRYGDRDGTLSGYERVRQLDLRVQAAKAGAQAEPASASATAGRT
jgi:hypothetical protein